MQAEYSGSRQVRACVEGCAALADYPRQLIAIRVDVERDDGASIAAACNAAVLALLDAGISMFLTPAAISLCRLPGNVELTIDPLKQEENISEADLLFSYGQEQVLLLVECSGNLATDEFENAMSLALEASEAIRSFMRSVVSQSIGLLSSASFQ